ncbi:hypothetical protein HNY73_019037 [Argiope bruennichi]|uniref:Uncharacterized protein n=1 Tax=Argiope bruennichi TaxID=94029 RepID=A0A8T0EID4_ARGBR|nr:hypothetical protein HNY73_019037 [Argiope bruennichi]
MNHCTEIRNLDRELTAASNKSWQIKHKLKGECNPEEKASLLKRLEVLNRKIQTNEEKLKNAKPCLKRNCTKHDGNKNLCAHINYQQIRSHQLNSIANSFIDTLQQMKDDNLEHTSQYKEDYIKLQGIQHDIKKIEDELMEVSPCPIMNCDKHNLENENQPSHPETMMETTESKNNNLEEMETELPFQPVDRKHSSKRKNSVENPEVTTRNKFQILEEEAPKPRKEIPPIQMKLTEGMHLRNDILRILARWMFIHRRIHSIIKF